MKTNLKSFLTLFLSLMLTGCIVSSNPKDVDVPNLNPIDPMSVTPSKPFQTRVATKSQSITKQAPQQVTSSNSQAGTTTPTPISTFSPKDIKVIIPGILKNNRGCQLPCLLGFTPAQSNTRSFNDFRSSFGEIDIQNSVLIHSSMRKGSGGIHMILWENSIMNTAHLSYWEEGEKLNILHLYAEVSKEENNEINQRSFPVFGELSFHTLFQYYFMPEILLNYGKPSQVFILPFSDEPELSKSSIIPFSMVLFYPGQGFFVEYIQPREEKNQQYFACPQKAAYLSLVAWQPDKDITFTYIAKYNGGLGLNSLNVNEFKGLEEAQVMSIEDFYQTYSDSKNSEMCIQTPKSFWSR